MSLDDLSNVNPTALDEFLSALRGPAPVGLFNPWIDSDVTTDIGLDAVPARTRRLSAHLAGNISYLLIGEAAGYQGCKVSGIPFTSERLILEGQIPRIAVPPGRLSSRTRPWSEPSATTVWKTLHALGIAAQTALWNACPWHPCRPDVPHSNRTPTSAERQAGKPALDALLRLLPEVRIFAVGRNAESSLAELGVSAIPLRHPSMGGAREFSLQLQRAVTKG